MKLCPMCDSNIPDSEISIEYEIVSLIEKQLHYLNMNTSQVKIQIIDDGKVIDTKYFIEIPETKI